MEEQVKIIRADFLSKALADNRPKFFGRDFSDCKLVKEVACRAVHFFLAYAKGGCGVAADFRRVCRYDAAHVKDE